MGFLEHIEEIRARAGQQITDGLVTKGYKLNPMQAVGVLNEALATELVLCTALQVSLVDMLREDLVAERMAIETYREIARYLGYGQDTCKKVSQGYESRLGSDTLDDRTHHGTADTPC